MPVAEKPQYLRALARATEVRMRRRTQRDELIGCSPETLTRALLDPPPELATYRLGELMCVGRQSLIPKFGQVKLMKALQYAELSRVGARGARRLRVDHRLSDLTPIERRRFGEALIAVAPKAWREGR